MLGVSIAVSTSPSTIHYGTSAAQPASGASRQLQRARRRFTVWATFTGAMTAVAGVLLIGDNGAPSMDAAMSAKVVGPIQADEASLILPREANLASGQWKSIVIHHSALWRRAQRSITTARARSRWCVLSTDSDRRTRTHGTRQSRGNLRTRRDTDSIPR